VFQFSLKNLKEKQIQFRKRLKVPSGCFIFSSFDFFYKILTYITDIQQLFAFDVAVELI